MSKRWLVGCGQSPVSDMMIFIFKSPFDGTFAKLFFLTTNHINFIKTNTTSLLIIDDLFLLSATVVNSRLYCMVVECDSQKLWKLESKELKRVRSTFTIESVTA